MSKPIHLVITYKNFSNNPGISHVGLGVAALNTAKTLRRCGIKASVWPLRKERDLLDRLCQDPTVTHCVVSAPWIGSPMWDEILGKYPDIQFAVNCHSNVGFLQADTDGVRFLREGIDIEQGVQNFKVAGNSKKFVRWLHRAYCFPCAYLPNLYYVDHLATRADRFHNHYQGGVLRIGAFGAIRPQKNLMSAAGAALEIANELKAETEIWINSEHYCENQVQNSINALLDNLPGIRIVRCGWSTWPDFRRTVRTMHLLLQVSYTESFNNVTADGVVEGVPSVVSNAIEWVPEYWQARMDDVNDIARVGQRLIYDRRAPRDGLIHLERHNYDSARAWGRFLGVSIEYKPLIHDLDAPIEYL